MLPKLVDKLTSMIYVYHLIQMRFSNIFKHKIHESMTL